MSLSFLSSSRFDASISLFLISACLGFHRRLALSKALVRRVEEYGGRFLEKKDGKWCVMGKEDSRKKASQVLREEKWN